MRRLLPFLSLLALSPGVSAQSSSDWGIFSGGECMNGKDMVISANPNSTYTLTSVLLPVDSLEVTTSASLSKTVNARKQLIIALDDDTFDDTSISIEWYVGRNYGTPVSLDEQSIRLKPTDDYYSSGKTWCKLTYETGCVTWLSISWNSSDFASVNKSLSYDLDVDVTSDSNEVSVTMLDDPEGAKLTVYSNDGVVVDSRSLERRTANVSLSSLRKGIYVFRVTSPKGQYSFKRIWRGNK